ncbi:MAG: hypothetical protein ACR2J1_11665 [Methyloceanibacter sp.]|uniref:hypothetical protein n=1 Tax=Methyloceanibacter sp. TaxID=1965321 RepID=UPI003D9BEA0C
MAQNSRSMTLACVMGAAVAFGLAFASTPAAASPLSVTKIEAPALLAEKVRIYKRGRTPIYPYVYNPGRPGGWSSYFGFVPYQKGDIANQALQRQFNSQYEWIPPFADPPPPRRRLLKPDPRYSDR